MNEWLKFRYLDEDLEHFYKITEIKKDYFYYEDENLNWYSMSISEFNDRKKDWSILIIE